MEARRSNALHAANVQRGRFVWTLELGPGSSLSHQNFILRNSGTDTAKDVVLVPVDQPPHQTPDFRDLPNGAPIHGPGFHEFYCDPSLGEVLPREMRLSWRGHDPRTIALPSV